MKRNEEDIIIMKPLETFRKIFINLLETFNSFKKLLGTFETLRTTLTENEFHFREKAKSFKMIPAKLALISSPSSRRTLRLVGDAESSGRLPLPSEDPVSGASQVRTAEAD